MLMPVVEFDPLLLLTYANPPALEILQLSKQALDAGVHVDALVVPEQHELVHDGLNLLRKGADPQSISLRILNGKGVKIPTQVYTDRIIVDGKHSGFTVYIVDLSRRAAAEEKVLSRKEILELIVDYYSFSGIIIVDESYTFEYVNDKMCDILGRRRSELLGHDFREFLHKDSLEMVAERYERRQKGEDVPSVYEFQVVHKDGSSRDIRMNVGTIKTRDGNTRTVAQLLDITEEKKRKLALEESEHRYRSLVETMDSGLCVDDNSGITVLANDALRRMLGYDSVDELIGIPITDLLHGWTQEDVQEKMIERKAGKIEHYEAQLEHKSGAVVPAMISASPLFGPDERYLGSMAIFTDVSELKQAEVEVYFLLDLLLHDIGNQLQLILAGGDFLEPDASPDQIERSKRYVLDGANRCLELIQKIRRAEESKSEPLKPVNIIDVIMAESELLYKQRGVKVDLGDLPSDVFVLADQAASQLVWNLLENAVVHNDMEPPKKLVRLRGRVLTNTFSMSISDNGPGLNDKKKLELFDPSRRYGGVGMHLVRRLVEKYDGTFEVADRIKGKPEHGLKVTIKLLLA
jgi:PAS domain S-box-containing protein